MVDPHNPTRTRAVLIAGAWVVGLIIVVLAVVFIPRSLSSPPDDIVAGPPGPVATGDTDPAPAGWRIEQYRRISFHVPDSWGYAYEPGSAWCAADGGDESAEVAAPYVALGTPSIVPAIACPPVPDRLMTEHVQVAVVDGASGGERTVNGHWVITRLVGGVEVKAVSRDRSRAQRIADSATVSGPDAPCAPTMSTSTKERPDPAFVVAKVDVTGDGMVCQYEDVTGSAATADLRARAVVSAEDLRDLTRRIGESERPPACGEQLVEPSLDLMLTVQIPTSQGVRDLQVRAGSCGDADSSGFGGFDDGTVVHRLERETCQQVMIGPVAIMGATADVAGSCMPR